MLHPMMPPPMMTMRACAGRFTVAQFLGQRTTSDSRSIEAKTTRKACLSDIAPPAEFPKPIGCDDNVHPQTGGTTDEACKRAACCARDLFRGGKRDGRGRPETRH